MEEKTEYVTDALEMMGAGYDQPAAVIDPSRKVTALRDGGLVEFRVWGWVKMSAKFIGHIRKLKGAKLAVWNCVALSIDETGTCKLSVSEIADLAGYSEAETRQTLKELDEMGYLKVSRKAGHKSIYEPAFAARSTNNPTDEPLQQTIPPLVGTQGYPSSRPIENEHPSIKSIKRVNTGKREKKDLLDAVLQVRSVEEGVNLAQIAFESALGFGTLPWDSNADWQRLSRFVQAEYEKDSGCFKKFAEWRAGAGKYDAMKNLAIRNSPSKFIDTGWATYQAINRIGAVEKTQVTKDKDGIPESW